MVCDDESIVPLALSGGVVETWEQRGGGDGARRECQEGFLRANEGRKRKKKGQAAWLDNADEVHVKDFEDLEIIYFLMHHLGLITQCKNL